MYVHVDLKKAKGNLKVVKIGTEDSTQNSEREENRGSV